MIRLFLFFGPAFVLGASVLTCLGALLFLISIFDVAPELSDNGFYLLYQYENNSILNQISGFGILLKTFFGTPPVKVMRALHIVLLFAGPAAFIWISSRSTDLRTNAILRTSLAIFAGAGAWAYFKWGMMDASYNSLLIPLLMASLTALWCVCDRLQQPDQSSFSTPAFLAGVFLLAFAWVKISSGAALFVVFLLPLLGVVARKNRNRIGAYSRELALEIAAILLGAACLIGVIWLRGLPPWDIMTRFMTGLETTDLLGVHSLSLATILQGFELLWGTLVHQLRTHTSTLLVLLACLVVAYFQPTRYRWQIFSTCALVAVGLMSFTFYDLRESFSDTVMFLWVTCMTLSLALVVLRARFDQLAVFTLTLAISPLLLTFGTFGVWSYHLVLFSGLSITTLCFVAAHNYFARPVLIPVVVLAAPALLIASFQTAYWTPYRMGGDSLALSATKYNLQGETFRAPPAMAPTYAALERIQKSGQLPQDTTQLIDMTGRTPTVNWALGFDVPAVAWILSGYKGSDDLLNWSLNQISDDDFAQAWILADETYKSRHKLETLNTNLARVGQTFPEDYIAIDVIPVPYISTVATLYAPCEPEQNCSSPSR